MIEHATLTDEEILATFPGLDEYDVVLITDTDRIANAARDKALWAVVDWLKDEDLRASNTEPLMNLHTNPMWWRFHQILTTEGSERPEVQRKVQRVSV